MKAFVVCVLFCAYAVNADFNDEIARIENSKQDILNQCNEYLKTESEPMLDYRADNRQIIDELKAATEQRCGNKQDEIDSVISDKDAEVAKINVAYDEGRANYETETAADLDQAVADLQEEYNKCADDQTCQDRVTTKAEQVAGSSTCSDKADTLISVIYNMSTESTNMLKDKLNNITC